MRSIVGLDINGWHDFAAMRAITDDTPEGLLQIIDGGIDTVVVDMQEQANAAPKFIGGPQAKLSPIGRGNGWGSIGAPERRVSVHSMFHALSAGDHSRSRAQQWNAAALALTTQADEIVACIADEQNFDENGREFVLNALKRPGISVRLLWRPVALLLTALEQGLIADPYDGMKVTCIDHVSDGYNVQTLTLRALEKHPGIFAPERADFGRNIEPNPSLFSLNELLSASHTAVRAANPEIEFERHGQADMAANVLLADAMLEDSEIIRADNGNWSSITPAKHPFSAQTLSLSKLDLQRTDLVLFTSPIAKHLLDKIVTEIAAACHGVPVTVLPREAAAKGALYAAMRIERGIPHYLDRLEQVSVAVLHGDDVGLADLVPDNAVVAANREFISAPVTGLGWPSGAKSVIFYIRKGNEFRKWTTANVSAPLGNQAVELRLRQMPAQGRAAIYVTSTEWDVLRRDPIFLDWSTLEVDPRSFEEIARELKPRPIVPARVTGLAHIDRWQGNSKIKAFTPFILNYSGDKIAELRTFLSSQKRMDLVGDGKNFVPTSIVNFDGDPPVGVEEKEIKALDNALQSASTQLIKAARKQSILSNNDSLGATTWSFGRCPLDLQDEIIVAAKAYLAKTPHPFLENNGGARVVMHGLGRVIKEPSRLGNVIDILLQQDPTKGFALAPLAALLSRPVATPHILDEARVENIVQFLAILLRHLREKQSFGTNLNYAFQIIGGLLRWRQINPYALLASSSVEAKKIHQQLLILRPFVSTRAPERRNMRAKLEIIDNLIAIITGAGGDSHILIHIERLEDDSED